MATIVPDQSMFLTPITDENQDGTARHFIGKRAGKSTSAEHSTPFLRHNRSRLDLAEYHDFPNSRYYFSRDQGVWHIAHAVFHQERKEVNPMKTAKAFLATLILLCTTTGIGESPTGKDQVSELRLEFEHRIDNDYN
jgi:hypothetical protein